MARWPSRSGSSPLPLESPPVGPALHVDESTEVSCGMALGRIQADFLDRAMHLMAGGGEMQNLLFVGPKGCGKRTVGKELADSFEMEFVRVPMDDTAAAISNCLFG